MQKGNTILKMLAVLVAIVFGAALTQNYYTKKHQAEFEAIKKHKIDDEKMEKQREIDQAAKAHDNDVKEVNEIISKASMNLLDPASAQFSSIKYIRDTKGLTICGMVNSKNSLGAYTGFQGFAIDHSFDGSDKPPYMYLAGEGVGKFAYPATAKAVGCI